jgi:hypothetical protein
MWEFQTSDVDAKVHHSMWDHAVLYADRSSNGELLLMRPLLQGGKKKEKERRMNE